MAKRPIVAPAESVTPTPAVKEEIKLTAKTQRLIDAIVEPFRAFTTGYAQLLSSRATLAPKFIRAFDAWHLETSGSFVDFVRVIEPTVPTDREGYRANTFYQAADYLRRLVALAEAPTRRPRDPNAPRPVSPIEAVARLVVTVAPFVDNIDIIWEAFLRELHWSDRQVDRVRKMVAKGRANPLLEKKGPKLTKLTLVERRRAG